MIYEIEPNLPSVDAFLNLRADTDWGFPDRVLVRAALNASLCGAIAVQDGKTVGMVRAVGDGVLNIYIQDVIIDKTVREQGVGTALMTAFLSYLAEIHPPTCMIGLFAAEGQNPFYEKFGFLSRPGTGFGPGMHATLSNLAQPDLAKANNAA